MLFDENSAGNLAGVLDAVCGIDEAGRGPLAGPVCAAAVVLPTSFPLEI
jgi:ribonuclease HIII